MYERYTKFDRDEKKDQDKMEDLTLEFEKLYNRIKQKSMELPEVVLAFKLLDASKIPYRDRQLVLTGINYSQKESLVVQMKMSLKKFHGEQSTGVSAEGCSNKPIELELGSEVLYSRDNDSVRKRQHSGVNKWRRRNFVTQKGPHQQRERTVNPKGSNGISVWGKICDSILHLFKHSPYRYDCPKQVKVKIYSQKIQMIKFCSPVVNLMILAY